MSIENELLTFLSKSSPNREARALAIQYLLGMTGTAEGRLFIGTGDKFIVSLTDLLDDEVEQIASDAHRSFINLATDEQLARRLSKNENFLMKIISCCISNNSPHADAAAMTLSNLAHWNDCASLIVEFLEKHDANFYIYRIVEVFCKVTDRLHYIASFLSSLTQVKEARKLVLDKNKCIIQKLFSFIQFKESRIRQNGIVGVIRNCCFEIEYHDWLLSEQIDILPRLVLPLAGPEEFDEEDTEKLPIDLQYLDKDKERESNADIRRMLIETVNQLCSTLKCREIIRSKNVYVIFRELHKWETDAACIVALENLVSVLISDEHGMDFDKVDIPEEIEQKLNKCALSNE